jgi:hypothetical protein
MESPCNIIGFFSVISSNRYTFFILEKKKGKKKVRFTQQITWLTSQVDPQPEALALNSP